MTWSENHGPDRLYRKYTVQRNSNRETLSPTEFVFVLRPETDMCACVALRAYAQAVRDRSPSLATEIETKVTAIMAANESSA